MLAGRTYTFTAKRYTFTSTKSQRTVYGYGNVNGYWREKDRNILADEGYTYSAAAVLVLDFLGSGAFEFEYAYEYRPDALCGRD